MLWEVYGPPGWPIEIVDLNGKHQKAFHPLFAVFSLSFFSRFCGGQRVFRHLFFSLSLFGFSAFLERKLAISTPFQTHFKPVLTPL